MKRYSLSFSLLWKVSIVIIASIIVLGYLSVKNVKNNSRKTIIEDSGDYVSTTQIFIGNTNSVMMQQLRSYTMLDDVCYVSHEPEVIQKVLVSKAKRRYKYFEKVLYVDYASGLAYGDDGSITDISNTAWHRTMLESRIQNKSIQLYADVMNYSRDNAYYPLCKEAEPKDENGYCYGYFVGYVPISYIQMYLDKLKGKNIESFEGFPLLVNKGLQIICSPEKDVIMNRRFINGNDLQVDEHIIELLQNPKVISKTSNVVDFSGRMTYKGKPYTVVVSNVRNTDWSVVIVVPDSTIDAPGIALAKSLIITGLFIFAIMMAVILLLFELEFKPLKVLNIAFTNIAEGDADLSKRLTITSRTEIGQIQKNFNTYTADLQKLISDIALSKKELTDSSNSIGVTLKSTENFIEDIQENIKAQNKSVAIINSKMFETLNNTTSIIDLIKQADRELVECAKSIKFTNGGVNVKMVMAHLCNINNELKEIHKYYVEVSKSLNSNKANLSEFITITDKLKQDIYTLDKVKDDFRSLTKVSSRAVSTISEKMDNFRF